MELVSSSPFSSATVLWRSDGTAGTLTVVVKATFELSPDAEATLAADQEPIAGDRHHGRDPRASLAMAGDYAPRKARGDVVVVGHAYAPHGVPVDALACRVTVGPMTRALRITGERLWTGSLASPRAGAPAPLMRVPLRYELAARTLANPVGLDLELAAVIGARALPSIELVGASGDPYALAGFGPIAPGWATRTSTVGSGTAWARELSPLDPGPAALRVRAPLPDAVDAAFFNVAPPHQRLEAITMGQEIVLENLDPELPLIETRLPYCVPQAFYEHPASAAPAPIPLACDTLVIDSDRRLAIVSWRGEVEVELSGTEVVGRITVTEGSATEARTHASGPAPAPQVAGDVTGQTLRDEDVLSLREGLAGAPQAAAVKKPWDEEMTRSIVWTKGTAPATPFVAAGEHHTMDVDRGAAPPHSTPFVRSGRRLRTMVFAAAEPVGAPRSGDTLTLDEGARLAAALQPRVAFEVPAAEVEPAEPATVRGYVPPPVEDAPRAEEPAPEAEEPAPEAPSKREAEGVSLEEVAAIAAAIDQDPEARAGVLEEARIDGDTLNEALGRAQRLIRADASRGSTAALARWDAAWVGTVERMRGRIVAAEYAAIAVAAERGTVGGVLAELRIGRGGLLPVERSFLRRMAGDLALHQEIVRAVAAARRG